MIRVRYFRLEGVEQRGATALERFDSIPPDAPCAVIEIDERQDPFAVLEQCFRKIDEQGPAARAERQSGTAAEGSASAGAAGSGNAGSIPAGSAKSGVRDSSMAAYRGLQWSGKLTEQQRTVLSAVLSGRQADWTRQELARATGLGINAICGRVNELLREPIGLLVEVEGRRRCRITGENVHALRAAEHAAGWRQAA